MNGKTLLEAIGYADEKYVSRTFSKFYVSKTGEKASGIWDAVKIAAGVAAVLAVILAIWIPSILSRGPYTPGTTDTGTAPAKTELTSASDTDGITTAEPVVTEPPTTEPNETEPPTTEAPATEPPTTEAPATEPPTTEAPVTEPPTTEAPETEPPVTEPPVTLVSTIKINASQTSLVVGETMKLTATVKPDNADNKAVKWSISSGSSYAKISSDGTLTAVKAGQCTVKATAEDASGVSATVKITITEPEVLTFEEAVLLPVDAPQRALTADEKERLFKIFINIMRNYECVTPGERFQIWISCAEPDILLSVNDVNFEILSGSQFAEITDKGVFTAKAVGEVKIRVFMKSDPGLTAERTITITVPEKVDTWKGSGTFRDPYLIESVEDFEKIRDVSKHDSNVCYWFKQTKDLDFSGILWKPFQWFTHKYDGGGHKITNVTVDSDRNSYYKSLFGYVQLAVIKNLTVEHFTLKNDVTRCFDAGVLFGAGARSSFFNCTVRDAVVELTGPEDAVAGGFAGASVEPCVFAHCSTDAVCKATFAAGGFIGNIEMEEMATIFYDCHATGTAESPGDPARCGGFFGDKQDMFDWFIITHYIIDCTCVQKDDIIEAAGN